MQHSNERTPYNRYCFQNFRSDVILSKCFYKSLKTGKVPSDDDIRPKMIKAINGHGVRWLTLVCQIAKKTR